MIGGGAYARDVYQYKKDAGFRVITVGEKEDPYDELGKISPVITGNENIHVQDIIILDPEHNLITLEKLKKMI